MGRPFGGLFEAIWESLFFRTNNKKPAKAVRFRSHEVVWNVRDSDRGNGIQKIPPSLDERGKAKSAPLWVTEGQKPCHGKEGAGETVFCRMVMQKTKEEPKSISRVDLLACAD